MANILRNLKSFVSSDSVICLSRDKIIYLSKAVKFAEPLSITDFKASEGFLGQFKQRHCINYGKLMETQEISIQMLLTRHDSV